MSFNSAHFRTIENEGQLSFCETVESNRPWEKETLSCSSEASFLFASERQPFAISVNLSGELVISLSLKWKQKISNDKGVQLSRN